LPLPSFVIFNIQQGVDIFRTSGWKTRWDNSVPMISTNYHFPVDRTIAVDDYAKPRLTFIVRYLMTQEKG